MTRLVYLQNVKCKNAKNTQTQIIRNEIEALTKGYRCCKLTSRKKPQNKYQRKVAIVKTHIDVLPDYNNIF